MPDMHLNFHSTNGKRLLLVVEDEAINREILGVILEEEYECIYAQDGKQALEFIYSYKDILSMILLDLNLPDVHGLEILRQVKGDPQLTRIPVIVMTSDKDAEVESLTIGAIDFIPKPYPRPQVILARILRTIELSEDQDIIRSTERDQLTGLYNREYFYRYADQYDLYHKEQSMDAIVIDISHFHLINERYGKAYGDDVLKRVGEKIRAQVAPSGGIVCRRGGDTFLIYCPHRDDHGVILEQATAGMDSRVRLRMGIYPQVDKSIDIERRFDRAKLAADTVRNSFSRSIGIYDHALQESEIYSEQLLEDFEEAIASKQFMVYYQPKFNIRSEKPFLNSAEALVRWKHPELGMISPGTFIPLFENNGLIQRLDSYVWRETAAQLKEWKERLGLIVPVSVNVSRIDMFEPELALNMKALMDEFELTPEHFLLEITESAYTQDSEQIIRMVNELRNCGFKIEMDDFGSGYSSLNMISTLPIDALKLDMQFIRNAFKERKNTRMLEFAIDIAESLSVPTIAEGVETEEQLFSLQAMGCDIVQGYYFSRPIPPEEFEAFLLELKRVLESAENQVMPGTGGDTAEKYTDDELHDPMTGLYNSNACKMLLKDTDDSTHIAILIVSVDDYELLRAKYGQDMTDRTAVRVAQVLLGMFRSVDYVCRINNDEFVVILTQIDGSKKDLVSKKVEQINEVLCRRTGDLPPISLSVGAAFADRENPKGDLFHDADLALNRMKEMKRSGCSIY